MLARRNPLPDKPLAGGPDKVVGKRVHVYVFNSGEAPATRPGMEPSQVLAHWLGIALPVALDFDMGICP